MFLGNRNLQQLNHQANDFARREMISGFLASLFRKPPQQLLINVSHLQIRQVIGTEWFVFVLIEDWSEPIALDHLADDLAIVEVLDNLINVLRESIDVVAKVLSQ